MNQYIGDSWEEWEWQEPCCELNENWFVEKNLEFSPLISRAKGRKELPDRTEQCLAEETSQSQDVK